MQCSFLFPITSAQYANRFSTQVKRFATGLFQTSMFFKVYKECIFHTYIQCHWKGRVREFDNVLHRNPDKSASFVIDTFWFKQPIAPMGDNQTAHAHTDGLAEFAPSPIATKGFWMEKGRDTSKKLFNKDISWRCIKGECQNAAAKYSLFGCHNTLGEKCAYG